MNINSFITELNTNLLWLAPVVIIIIIIVVNIYEIL